MKIQFTHFAPKTDTIQTMAWFLILVFITTLFPNYSFAGGPTQPESQSFTPVSVSNMVDPFTGDFSYNLPLMDVEGYPINIAYDAGVTMDQESSWVGLGWNLNVGSVDRALRGLPDDFNGDEIIKYTKMKPNQNYSLDMGANFELFGKKNRKKKIDPGTDTTQGTIKINLGATYNNYTGYGFNFSLGGSWDFLKSSSHDLTAGFSLSGSSENGSSFSPSLSYSKKLEDGTNKDRELSGNIGTSFNSRAGLTAISYEMSNTKRKEHTNKDKKDTNKDKVMGYSFRTGISGSYNIGLATYSPSASQSMKNVSLRGNLKLGPDIMGGDATFSIGVSYSSNWIPKGYDTLVSPAYGYLFLEKGQENPKGILDFNRDNDGSFSKETPFIGSAHLTNDIFSVKAQGISGSYKPFRTDIGFVFDAEKKTISHDGAFGVEVGVGNTAKYGFDASYNRTSAYTGMWKGRSNQAADYFLFKDQDDYGMVRSPFVEAGESAVDEDLMFTSLGKDLAIRFDLAGSGLLPKLKKDVKNGTSTYIGADTDARRTLSVKRNQVMSFLSVEEVKNGLGVNRSNPLLNVNAKGHHIGEITQLGTDGRRYVFGLPAYNKLQKDVTFATGESKAGGVFIPLESDYSGMINYAGHMAGPTKNNNFGIDNYYQSEVKPAYAHSFMLTAVLTDDYIDNDTVKGPSIDDLGGYVKFEYQKTADYKWRAPLEKNKAYHNEGMRSNLKDDRASYVYGEKDLFYVYKIETKNYLAVFTMENKADGYGVTDENGGVSTSNASSKLLRKISLYNRLDYVANPSLAVPIQEVHFEYSYELCQNYPGNVNTHISGSFVPPAQDVTGTGKLTLKKIYFSYQNSLKMKQSPYSFSYSAENPNYNLKSVDRWGNYKPSAVGTTEHVLNSPMNNSDYPYATQERALADQYASAWNLVNIKLPSGGEMIVEYEADDYAFVQHLPAMVMAEIVGIESRDPFTSPTIVSISNETKENVDIKVKVNPANNDPNAYISIGEQLYFRCLVEVDEDWDETLRSTYEYVSGYGTVKTLSCSSGILTIGLEPEKLVDVESASYSPITKSAIQFGRMYLSKDISSINNVEPSEGSDEAGILEFAKSVVNAMGSYAELFTGPNKAVWNKDRLRRIVTHKSWVRLREPTHSKIGGGHRVKRILMKDNWNSMASGLNHTTGQEFSYLTAEGTSSSGVASYEPQLGGDENPWHSPVVYNQKKRFAVDDKLYAELPLMESQFPSPTVGYSRVVIKDIVVPNGTLSTPIAESRGTGHVVKEFYTARDFPTFVNMTDLYNKTANSFLPMLPKYQFATVSQGFSIELNNMHGKPKGEKVYAVDKPEPISSVSYEYLFEEVVLNGDLVKKLKNTVETIDAQGNVSQQELGVKREAVTDFRQSTTNSAGGSMEFNVNGLFVFLPLIVPTAWPSIDISSNSFRSASFNKTINRFGIQSATEAQQDGSIVRTTNLAYDKETGEVLLNQTQTNFNDDVYSMNYPAYWKYEALGQAYKNLGVKTSSVDLNLNGFAVIASAKNYFTEGDQVSISRIGIPISAETGWVVGVSTNGVTIVDKAGVPITGSSRVIKVIRSGYRNKQSTSMASLTTRQNPLFHIRTNQYDKVLNAGAIEMGQNWKTYCDCFGSATIPASSNPYVLGTKGSWRPVKSLTHLTERTQSDYNENSNIRQDGMFMSYTPYYKMLNGKWDISPQNWTFVSEVTQFSPNGMTLETKDALNRFSASTYGFKNTLTTAVGANAQYRQLGFSSFEDGKDNNCLDNHFKFSGVNTGNLSADAHTGRTSVRVSSTSDVKVAVTFTECDEVNCSSLSIQPGGDEFYINGGTAPYQVEYEVISGNGEVSIGISDNQLKLNAIASGYNELEYKITDANGCILINRYSITK